VPTSDVGHNVFLSVSRTGSSVRFCALLHRFGTGHVCSSVGKTKTHHFHHGVMGVGRPNRFWRYDCPYFSSRCCRPAKAISPSVVLATTRSRGIQHRLVLAPATCGGVSLGASGCRRVSGPLRQWRFQLRPHKSQPWLRRDTNRARHGPCRDW
jgi:hypothetical protein